MYGLNPALFSFAYRSNDDGTFRSICSRCLQTIAQSAREADLQNAEDSHVCDPSTVERYRRLSKAVSDYRVESRGHVHRDSRQFRLS
jgi:hypothetical protein